MTDASPPNPCTRCGPVKEMLAQKLENTDTDDAAVLQKLVAKFTALGMCIGCKIECEACIRADDLKATFIQKHQMTAVGSETKVKLQARGAPATETHQYWSRRGPEPCPKCHDPTSEEILELQNVMFGQYQMKKCTKCGHRWRCSVAEDPD